MLRRFREDPRSLPGVGLGFSRGPPTLWAMTNSDVVFQTQVFSTDPVQVRSQLQGIQDPHNLFSLEKDGLISFFLGRRAIGQIKTSDIRKVILAHHACTAPNYLTVFAGECSEGDLHCTLALQVAAAENGPHWMMPTDVVDTHETREEFPFLALDEIWVPAAARIGGDSGVGEEAVNVLSLATSLDGISFVDHAIRELTGQGASHSQSQQS